MLLSLRWRRQLWRVDVDCVLAAVRFIQFDQSGVLWSLTVHLVCKRNTNSAAVFIFPFSCSLNTNLQVLKLSGSIQIRPDIRVSEDTKMSVMNRPASEIWLLLQFQLTTGHYRMLDPTGSDRINLGCSDLDKIDAMLL